MSAVVRRLGSLTPEAVVCRRGSCGALNSPSQVPPSSHRRRASVGPSDATFICPNYTSSNSQEKNLCSYDSEIGLPSAAYLSRKRASIDNTWLTQWILPNDALTRQDAVVVRSPGNSLVKCCEEDCPTFSGEYPLNSLHENWSPHPSKPNFSSSNTPNTDLSKDSCQCCGCLQLNSSHFSPRSDKVSRTTDDFCHKTKLQFPDITISPPTEQFDEHLLGQAFNPSLSRLCCHSNLVTKSPLQEFIGLDRRKTSSRCQSYPRQQISNTGSHRYADSSSQKERNGRRKRSSPVIVFPSLSPCIEDKTKTSQFNFDTSSWERKECSPPSGEQGSLDQNPLGDIRRNSIVEFLDVIPKIKIDIVDSDSKRNVQKQKENSALLQTPSDDEWCQNFDKASPCVHCSRRRHSLEMQSCNACRRTRNSNTSQPLTPQPWQLQSHLLHHFHLMHSSGWMQRWSSISCRRAFENLERQPVGSVIGRGGFGIVKLGCCKGIYVAVKVLRGEQTAVSSLREAHALQISPHTHVNSTYAVVTPSTTTGFARISWSVHKEDQQEETLPIEAATSLFGMSKEDCSLPEGRDLGDHRTKLQWAWVVSELCTPYTLLKLINDPKVTLTSREKVRFTGEIASGLSFLHSQGLVHLDVKPANILISKTGHLRIADFGCCMQIFGDVDQNILGTVHYQAPEVLRGTGGSDKSDIFSLGVTMWHLLTLTPPYHGLHPHVVLYQVTRLGYRPSDCHSLLSESSTLIDQLLARVARHCWAEDPSLRPSAADLSASLAALYLSPAT